MIIKSVNDPPVPAPSDSDVSNAMNYYQISFGYYVSEESIKESWEGDPNNEGEHVTSPEESHALMTVEIFLHGFFCGANISVRHSYSFPDGSCYKYIKFAGNEQALRTKIESLFAGTDVPYGLYIERIYPEQPDKETHKVGSPTLEELFSRHT